MQTPDRNLDLRAMLASIGALVLAVAYGLGAITGGLGHCLQTAGGGGIHCPLCLLGGALLTAAVLPWPRLRRAARA